MSYGLLSALSWGISTLMAAVAARRIGALRTVVIGEAAGLAGYWTLFLLAGLIFFTGGDQVGLVAVTATVSSAYPIIPLIGGLLFFRERLMRQQVGGAVLILVGLVLLGFSS